MQLGCTIVCVPDVAASLAYDETAFGLQPWGQVVSYVRAPDGTLVEPCTPVRG